MQKNWPVVLVRRPFGKYNGCNLLIANQQVIQKGKHLGVPIFYTNEQS